MWVVRDGCIACPSRRITVIGKSVEMTQPSCAAKEGCVQDYQGGRPSGVGVGRLINGLAKRERAWMAFAVNGVRGIVGAVAHAGRAGRSSGGVRS